MPSREDIERWLDMAEGEDGPTMAHAAYEMADMLERAALLMASSHDAEDSLADWLAEWEGRTDADNPTA